MSREATTRQTTELQKARVRIASDRLTAELIISAGVGRSDITVEQCIHLLRDRDVIITPHVRAAVTAMCNALPKHGAPDDPPTRTVVAQGQPAEHGADGQIEWLVHCARDLEPDPDEQINHYDRSAFILVEPDQKIARIRPPTTGCDGLDVTGKPLPATPGRVFQLKLDDTTRLESDHLIAAASGVLYHNNGAVAVRQLMELNHDIDFDTGNIDFKGDIHITGNVLDLFNVKATGDIEVRGLIEAANIQGGGKLRALGGMTGWPDGVIHTGDDCEARFLNGVRGEVAGTLRVGREILNCHFTVHGDIEATHGNIVGGELQFKGRLTAKVLGSGAGVSTLLVPHLGPDLDITVTQAIHPGAVIRLGRQELRFRKKMDGPLQIAVSEAGRLLYRGADQRARLLTLLRGAKLIDI